jgi:diguanylate cyclase (GGDEF)-like protein
VILAVTELLPGPAAPLTFWVLGFLFVAGGAGFLAGASFAWLSSRSKLKRSLRTPGNLMPVVREQLQAALEATKALKDRKQVVLSEEETTELSSRRDSLLSLLNEIVELQQQVAATIEGKPRPGFTGSMPFEIAWEREPVDELTKLPTAEVMANNLKGMLAQGTENHRKSGFLFVKLDGYEKLLDRHGGEGRDTLLKKFASVIIRAAREEDLVCRYDTDTIAVLFPSLEEAEGMQLAHAIRKTILSYQFRFSESGPAVILNSHFGYTDCLPHENEDLILNRAGNALAKSQSRGFNQMHVHDGEDMHFSARASLA